MGSAATLWLPPNSLLSNFDFEAHRQLTNHEIDAKILQMFCSCLEVWDEPRKLSFITDLKVIWVEDNELEDDLQTWLKYISDFDPLTFGLEGKIQQNKSLIEHWCEVWVRSSIQCNKFSTDHQIFSLSDDSLSEEQTLARYIKKHARFNPVLAQLHLYLMELRFLWSFFQCFETWDDSDEETRVLLSPMVTSLQRIWGQEYDMGLLSGCLYAISKGGIADWHPLDLELQEKFQMSKKEFNAWLESLSGCSFQCRPSRSNKILKILESILCNVSDLGADKDVAFKTQVEILEEKLLLLKNLLKLATNCADSKNLEEFNMLAQAFANNAACIIYLYWTKEANEDIPAKTNIMLSNMLQKIKLNTHDVARLYLGTLKAICLEPCDSLLLKQTATSFIDYFFEDLVTPWKNELQIHRDEVIFHLTFINHHHTRNAEEVISSQLDVLFGDGVYDLLSLDDMKGDFSKKKIGLSNFVINNRTDNAQITQLYCKLQDSFSYDFPRINGQGFLDCLVQKLINLKERMITDRNHVPFAKYKIMMIEKELVSLTPIFNHVFELKELSGAWLEVVSVVYLAELVISSCFIFYRLILYYIPYLSDVDVAERIKLERIKGCDMSNGRCLSHSTRFMSTHLKQHRTSEIYEVVVVFELDEKIIIDNITKGIELLDIVSVVGMDGLGKTTLVKKVFGSSTISQNHNKTQEVYESSKILHCTRRFWNINAWDKVRRSIPDDQNWKQSYVHNTISS